MPLQRLLRRELSSEPLISISRQSGGGAEYERQFALYAQRFDPATAEVLDRVMATGHWHKSKPGLVLAFYNG
jgi:hypothetical protein